MPLSSGITKGLTQIVQELKRKGMPIKAIARNCGCSERRLYNLMSGDTKDLYESEAIKLRDLHSRLCDG